MASVPLPFLIVILPFAHHSFRHGSNERDRSSPPARSSPVILSEAKDLSADRDRPFAEFPLSEANVLRVTRCDCSCTLTK